MNKILIIVGVIAAVGFLFLIVIIFAAATMIRRAEGPALYSSVGAWTRIDEYAHAERKTNYIAAADSTLALLQKNLDEWRQTAPASEISKYQGMQATAYTTEDKNIKNGENPLAFLDITNAIPPATPAK